MSLASRLIKAIFATEGGVLTAASSPAASDNSKKIATTEWAALGFAISKTSPGYIKFPTWLGGLIVQWGNASFGATALGATYTTAVTFPVPFPNGCLYFSAIAVTNEPSKNFCTTDYGIATGGNVYTYSGVAYAAGSLGMRWLTIGH